MWTKIPGLFEYSPNWKQFTQLKLKSRDSYNCDDDDDDSMARGRELHELHTAYYRPDQPVARRHHVARGVNW